jgi:hypothetical protein
MALRARPVAACLGLVLLAHPQTGLAITPWSPWEGYLAELKRQCPDKQLFRLDVRDLHAALAAFQATLPRGTQTEIEEAQAAGCSAAHNAYGPSCENATTVGIVMRDGRLPEAVSFICAAYLGCTDQSDCTAAPR